MENLRILRVLPAMGQGGVEQGTIDLAKYFAFKNLPFFVASKSGVRLKELKKTGAIHFDMPMDSKNPVIQVVNYIRLRKLIRRHQITLIHVRSRAPAWSAYFAAKHEGIKTVSTFHGTYNFSNFFKKFYNSIMVRPDRIIVGSEFIRQHVLSKYGNFIERSNQIKLIYRGIDTNYYDPDKVDLSIKEKLTAEWGLKKNHLTLLFPGRLTRWKGQKIFLESLVKLKESNVKFQVVILGSAQGRLDYREELKKTIDKNHLKQFVKFVDHCSNMREAYSLADIVVHASTDPEAFGRIIAEAQAMGKAVICSDKGAPREIIVLGITGMLHVAGDVGDLANKILEIISLKPQEQKVLAQVARGHVLTHFTSSQMCEKTVELYKEILTSPSSLNRRKILVIKHGALGDIFIAMGAFKAIRDHHPNDHIILMTTSSFTTLAEDTPYFDEIWLDERHSVYNLFYIWKLRKKIIKAGFQRVYDLQNSPRTSLYFKLLGKKNQPEWCGIAPGCSMRQTIQDREFLHAYPRFEDQLRLADIKMVPRPDLSWAKTDIRRFKLPSKYALLIPGSSPARPMKRWPVIKYVELGKFLLEKDIVPVIIGGKDESIIVEKIKKLLPNVVDLSGQTGLYDIIELARKARVTVGNDTGPLHIAALANCPTVVVWSAHSDPAAYAPLGEHVRVIYEANLENLSLEPVQQAVVNIMKK